MFIKIALLVLFVALLGLSTKYLAEQHSQQMVTASRAVSQNVTSLGMLASHYAASNPTVVGAPSSAQINLPGSFVNSTQTLVYVNKGSAYAYILPGGELAPSVALAETSAGQRGLKIGIVAGGLLVDGAGQSITLMQPLPASIPDGSMVYVSRDVAAPVSHPAPSRVAEATAAPLGSEPAIPPPTTFSVGGGTAIAWAPSGATNPPTNVVSGPAPTSSAGNEGGGTTGPSSPPPTLHWLNMCSSTHTNDGTWDGCMIYPPDSTESPTPWSQLQLSSDWHAENLNNTSVCSTIGSYALTGVMIHPEQGVLAGQFGFECGYINASGGYVFQ